MSRNRQKRQEKVQDNYNNSNLRSRSRVNPINNKKQKDSNIWTFNNVYEGKNKNIKFFVDRELNQRNSSNVYKNTYNERYRQQLNKNQSQKNNKYLKKQSLNFNNKQLSNSNIQQIANPIQQKQQKPMSHSSIGLQKYRVGSNSGMRRQYQKFFINDENVFYQDSKIIREAECIDILLPILIFLFVIIFVSYFCINLIIPYDKKCPFNATCGVYIHCHYGYILNKKLQICEVDPQIKQSAQAFVDQAISELQYQYGDNQCKEIFEYVSGLNGIRLAIACIEGSDYRNIWQLESSESKRVQQGLQWNNTSYDKVIFIALPFIFVGIVVFMVIMIFVLWYLIRNYLRNKKAQNIYKFLKREILKSQSKIIDFNQYSSIIEQKFNNDIKISSDQWVRINSYRIKQKHIGQYDDSTIKWKLFK